MHVDMLDQAITNFASSQIAAEAARLRVEASKRYPKGYTWSFAKVLEFVPTFREQRFFRLLIEGNDPGAALQQTINDLPQRYWDCFVDAICGTTEAAAKQNGKAVSGGFSGFR